MLGSVTPPALALASGLHAGILVLAAVAGAVVLLAPDPKARGAAMLAALVAAGVGLLPIVGPTLGEMRPSLLAAGGLAGAGTVVALGVLLRARPGALALLAVAALPFRVPVVVGDQGANLLVPLYLVIAAGAVAYALGPVGRDQIDPEDRPRLVRAVEKVLAAVLVLYALQALYTTDVEQAAKNVCFFYVPFAVLFRILADLRWDRRVLQWALGLTAGMALVFAAIGFVEYATGHLIITNPKVLRANELKPYFRVNSLFFDPNIYGRFLALTMLALAAALLWARRARTMWLASGALAVLWAGLVLSLSQSSYAALLVGLVVLGALRWRPVLTAGAAIAAVVAAVAVVALAPGAVGLSELSSDQLDKATSGRVGLIDGGVAMATERPVWGYGSGSFAERFRAREGIRSSARAAISHTIPVTVAAEQGLVGLAAYLALVVVTLALVLAGVRRGLRARAPGGPTVAAAARAAVAAAYCALVLHTLTYASYLEDPLSWVLLGLAAALLIRPDADAPKAAPAGPGDATGARPAAVAVG